MAEASFVPASGAEVFAAPLRVRPDLASWFS
jgi:hypothetical protein